MRTAAEALRITQWQLLDAMDGALAIPVAEFDEVCTRLQALEQVMLHLGSGSAVLQLTTYAVFLVREQLLKGQESLSIALVGEDEKIALSIYLRRGEDGKIRSSARALFEELWSKYQNEQE